MKDLKTKLALAAATAGAVASQAGAEVIESTTTPVSTPGPGNTDFWDVDNAGTNDFANARYYGVAIFNDTNGGRLLVPTATVAGGIMKLSSGFVVGPLMTQGKFWAAPQTFNSITGYGYIGGDAKIGGWSLGDTGFFGFKFTNASGTHYGWGEMAISPSGRCFTINEGWYESEANQGIEVGDGGGEAPIPEPNFLGLLALGYIGAAARRRRA
jgi:MYXO-CTERM domain-containing protein